MGDPHLDADAPGQGDGAGPADADDGVAVGQDGRPRVRVRGEEADVEVGQQGADAVGEVDARRAADDEREGEGELVELRGQAGDGVVAEDDPGGVGLLVVAVVVVDVCGLGAARGEAALGGAGVGARAGATMGRGGRVRRRLEVVRVGRRAAGLGVGRGWRHGYFWVCRCPHSKSEDIKRVEGSMKSEIEIEIEEGGEEGQGGGDVVGTNRRCVPGYYQGWCVLYVVCMEKMCCQQKERSSFSLNQFPLLGNFPALRTFSNITPPYLNFLTAKKKKRNREGKKKKAGRQKGNLGGEPAWDS